MDTTPIDRILAAIELATGPGKKTGPNRYELRCPAHPDHEPSLGLTCNSQDQALLYCQAGCNTADVLGAVGLAMRDLYPIRPDDRRTDPVVATYRYVDETGVLLFEVLRTASKKFRQRRPDPVKPNAWIYNLDGVRRVLYRLPAVMQAIHEGQTIYLPEGEKDVHTLEQDGLVATTLPGGVGKWRPEFTEALRGAHVVVICDRDTSGAGVRHGRNVAFLLQAVAASVTLMQPASGKDYTDHHTMGLGVDELEFVAIDMATPAAPPLPGQDGPVDGPPEPVSPAADDGWKERVRLTPASAFKIKPVRWMWQDRMPLGEICLVAGREGVGKSTFLAWLAAAITNGNLPGVYHGEPRAVLYSATEDAWSYTIAPRMLAAGANLDLVYRIDVIEEDGTPGKLILPRDSRHLPEIAESVKAAALMCDPILSLVDGRINPNQGSELRTALEPLKHAAEQAGLAIPALVHFNKTRDVDVLSMIAGSRSWAEVARAALAIAQDQDQDDYTCVVSQAKNNLGRKNLPNLTYTIDDVALETDDGPPAHIGRLRWTGESDTQAEEVLQRKPTGAGSRDTNNRTQTAIIQYLDDLGHAASPRQIADALPDVLNHENAKKTLARLAARGTINRVGTGLYSTTNTDVTGVTPEGREGQPLLARTRVDPSESLSLSPPQVRGVEGKGRGQEREGQGQGRKGYTPPVPQRSPDTMISCRGCHGPLMPVEEGQVYHPTCHPEDQAVDLTREVPPTEETATT